MISLRGLALAFGSTAAVATVAGAAYGDAQHTVVVCGDGPDGEEVVARVASHVHSPYRLQEASTFCKGLSSGRASAFAAAAKDRGADAKLVTRTRAAARSAHADLAILLDTRGPKHGATVVHVWLVDATGEGAAEVDHEVTLDAGASVNEQGDAAWNMVAADLGGASEGEGHSTAAAASPTPSDSSDGAPDGTQAHASPSDADHGVTEPESKSGEGDRGAETFSIRAAIETGSRDFTYVDRLTPTLRSYSLFAAPLGVVDAELYPLARLGTPVLKDFGVTFDYAIAFGLSSADSGGTSVSTAWSMFDVGAHERIHVGRSGLLGVHAGYGQMTYSFNGGLEATAELPGVQYRYVRGGADARVALGPFSVYGSGSYLDVLSTGPMGTYFARASVGGLEGRVGIARTLGSGFEVSLELAYTRFFYSLNPQPGDAYVAGGALDQMAFGSLGVAYVF
jgi:hypothetical protein